MKQMRNRCAGTDRMEGRMGQGIFKIGNLRKTYYYLRKNGLKSAYYAALERIMSEKGSPYRYEPPEEDRLAKQRVSASKYHYKFSILVPAYETKEEYLQEMVGSVLGQSYGNLELIIADASRSGQVRELIETYKDSRLIYLPLKENGGISENTNRALEAAAGDYVGLLDHDDVLTPDALYEMAAAINERENSGNTPWLLYSDEDKGNGKLTEFYEPHFKPELNVDLLLSNNYICHFTVMKRELMRELGFRAAYDGAQDYDLVLRAVGKLLYEDSADDRQAPAGRKAVVHVPKVLYHWRCHDSSTAENPESKRYAYEAGKRALEDFLHARGWQGTVGHTKHLGFYRIDYGRNMFGQRRDVGVVAGRLLDGRKRICGGAFDKNGKRLYAGLHRNFSGYMHRAVLLQEVCGADIRRMRVREELWPVFEEVFGVPYQEDADGWFDCAGMEPGAETEQRMPGKQRRWEKRRRSEKQERQIPGGRQPSGISRERRKQCMEFGRRVRREGYTVVWMPEDGGKRGMQDGKR